MTGQEICNLIDSLSKRGIDDTQIIEIIFETEGRQRQTMPAVRADIQEEQAKGE